MHGDDDHVLTTTTAHDAARVAPIVSGAVNRRRVVLLVQLYASAIDDLRDHDGAT